jgi:hypothetical protein
MNLEEDNRDDFFEDTPEVEPEKQKAPKPPVYSPDDPRYWEQPEDEFEHLKPDSRSTRMILVWALLVAAVAALVTAGYLYIFSPSVTGATQYGYVECIDHRGMLFKTYEGVILPYKSLMDTVRPYEGDFYFSTRNTTLATKLKRMQFANRPVRVEYEVYRSVMPWRGDQRILITRVDSVSESRILPPDRQPETVNPNHRNDTFKH